MRKPTGFLIVPLCGDCSVRGFPVLQRVTFLKAEKQKENKTVAPPRGPVSAVPRKAARKPAMATNGSRSEAIAILPSMANKALAGWQKVARSNIRYWGEKTGHRDLAKRFQKIVKLAVNLYDTAENVEAYVRQELLKQAGQPVTDEILEMVRKNVKAKREMIVVYFREWMKDLRRTKKLLEQEEYYLDAWLILSCYIGALAILRYPVPVERFDRAKYQYVVLKYSGKRPTYEKVDLLFFHQWDRSKYAEDNRYKDLKKHYRHLRSAVAAEFGTEKQVQFGEDKRYVSPSRIVGRILKHYRGLNSPELRNVFSLFSVLELLYRHVRNHAVHERKFPLVTKVYSGSQVRYKDNHIITGTLLYETTFSILKAIEAECVESVKFPHELRQRRTWT